MKRIAFSRRAADDLRDIVNWYKGVAPEALPRVIADINRSIDLLSMHPLAGMLSPSGKYRHTATRRYRYKIVYRVEPDCVLLLGIYRYQNREI